MINPSKAALESPAGVEERGNICEHQVRSDECSLCIHNQQLIEESEAELEEQLLGELNKTNVWDKISSLQREIRRQQALNKKKNDRHKQVGRKLMEVRTELNSLRSKQSELERENLELKKYAPRWIEQAKGATHSEGCWQNHRGCALEKIADLIQLVREYRSYGEHRYCVLKEYDDDRCSLCRRADELLK